MSITAIIVLSIILVLIMLFIFLTPRVKERQRLETKKEEINNYNTNVNKTLVIINNNRTYSTQNFLMPADDDIHYESTVHIPDIIVRPDSPSPSIPTTKDIPDLPTIDSTPNLPDISEEQTFSSHNPSTKPIEHHKKGKINIALPVPKPDPKETCQIFVTNEDVYISTPKTIFNIKIKDIVKASTKKQQSFIGTKKLGFMLDFNDEKKTLNFLEMLKKKKKKLEELAMQRRNRASSMTSSASSTQSSINNTPIIPMMPDINENAMVMKKKKY